MVELFSDFIFLILLSCLVIFSSLLTFLILRVYMLKKAIKNRDVTKQTPKIVENSFDKQEENKEEQEAQIDYVEKVYKLVDDVLSGKQELGDNDDET